ncbi:MAG TPA: putative dsRNA-binding protein, partial [Candidatus Xenobia bacterium]
KDFKGELQEKTQKRFRALPRYSVVREEGPPHSKSFAVQVNFGSKTLGTGVGPSKKEAEQAAAREALDQFDTLLANDEPPSPPER